MDRNLLRVETAQIEFVMTAGSPAPFSRGSQNRLEERCEHLKGVLERGVSLFAVELGWSADWTWTCCLIKEHRSTHVRSGSAPAVRAVLVPLEHALVPERLLLHHRVESLHL
jgi:hypothetical protein